MADTLDVPDLAAWLAACEVRGIRVAALRKTSEIRPEAREGHAVTVAPVSWVTLVGYRGGELVKTRLRQPAEGLRSELEERGFQVREVWDNLT